MVAHCRARSTSPSPTFATPDADRQADSLLCCLHDGDDDDDNDDSDGDADDDTHLLYENKGGLDGQLSGSFVISFVMKEWTGREVPSYPSTFIEGTMSRTSAMAQGSGVQYLRHTTYSGGGES